MPGLRNESAPHTRGRGRMRECRLYGSARWAAQYGRPHRDVGVIHHRSVACNLCPKPPLPSQVTPPACQGRAANSRVHSRTIHMFSAERRRLVGALSVATCLAMAPAYAMAQPHGGGGHPGGGGHAGGGGGHFGGGGYGYRGGGYGGRGYGHGGFVGGAVIGLGAGALASCAYGYPSYYCAPPGAYYPPGQPAYGRPRVPTTRTNPSSMQQNPRNPP